LWNAADEWYSRRSIPIRLQFDRATLRQYRNPLLVIIFWPTSTKLAGTETLWKRNNGLQRASCYYYYYYYLR